MDRLRLSYRELSTYSLAAQQNAYRLFVNARLHYLEDEGEEEVESPTLRNLTVKLECENGLLLTEAWEISQIGPGQYISLQDRSLQFSHDYLFNLSDETRLKFTFSVVSAESPEEALLTQSETLNILPANFWGGEVRQPELLAAFVKPNGVYVESLVKHVTEVLEANGHGRSADGYQSNSREKPYFMSAALWSVAASQRIAYVSPPPSFAHQGQLIRLASDISTSKMGACLDLSLLFASCLELMGLNTVIALTKDHAFVGVWLIDNMFPLLTNDDPMELRKRVDARDLILFESTMVTNSSAPTFLQACDHARSLLAEENEADFVYAIDIAQARARKIKPLATIEERREETQAEGEGSIALPPAPPLPPVRMDERVIEETPDTRIDTWQRKLLDLTKRNPLLSFRDTSSGVRIFCPDIGQMEDQLADDTAFSFESAEVSPVNDRERSAESFRLATGNDLHVEYALRQLAKNTLVANMSGKKVENTLVNLFRKAKNDLEEGGANTLFLALGMLSWKEDARDAKSYKAPLILVPVQLRRKSARASVKMSQLQDEDPLFNLTLIEFLYTEHAIDLSHLRDELPEDESGVDVAKIWQDVRNAVAEQPGFEVVEECVVASFSFAKFLMWKDLKDRIQDLKENLFVAHLVDHPQEAYQQEASFLLRDELDEKIDPAKIYVPLNCDSSQMVAVEAGSRPQNFVLEGPPGTGKSETIANMIVNNIAQGRKVLFVAEKIAALQVVYRRLQKIHLDDHVLELHSNKANKKAVLDQLRRTTEKIEKRTADEWTLEANRLRNRRDELNIFVKALHEPSTFGVSPRAAIARVAGYRKNQKVELNWGVHLSGAAVEGESGLEKLKETAKKAGLAYGDVSRLDTNAFQPITAIAWSYSWQAALIEHTKSFIRTAEVSSPVIAGFAAQFNIDIHSPTLSQIEQLNALSELIDMAQDQPIDFAIGPDVTKRLERLGELAEGKAGLDERLSKIAHGASAPLLAETSIDDWIALFEEAQQSWWKKLFIKGKLNKLAKSAGYQKFSELDILYALKEAKVVVTEVERLSQEFAVNEIWTGWSSESDRLQTKQVDGVRIHTLVKQAIGLADDPMELLTAIKTKLVDGRDFLEASQLVGSKHKFDSVRHKLTQSITDVKSVGVEIAADKPIIEYQNSLTTVIKNEQKLKPWVEWVAAKRECEAIKIDPVCHALEAGAILTDDAESQFYTAFCAWLAPRLIDDREPLRSFKASEHNSRIEEFRDLDAKVADTTAEFVSALLAQEAPDIKSRENSKDFGLLSRELQKKTRHRPIRVLFEDMGERLLDLCPCMMMSPLSVAQFLPSDFNAFDIVIFDEASQMTTWDSVGAIARGKNVIVVGDPKQMPPTNFFNATVDADDPDEDDLESILDQALAAGLPHLRLMGHYRSKHESLIAFSNSKYYENSLVTYPSSDTKESAVTFHRVEGVYAKGKGRNNPIEAKAVVEEVVRRLSHPRYSKQSLGIVTLNSDQQRTIEDLLDDARRRYPDIEPYFQATDDYDPVFVKNLESVQGDERDVIMFSLGYGPTEPGGMTMSMNFGPLNKSGGERRLNVAITRATTEVVVFASFDSSMIDLSRTSATAIEHLKHYLEFAEKGPIALAEQSTAAYGVDQFDSDFEQAVAWALRELGWQVQTQIGVSKFRVDLGVIHPDSPGLYLAGVECDGATYHGSPSARDRDRTRQAVLENLGWRLVRLWSTDYFRDPEVAIEQIHDRLNEILAEDRSRAIEEPDAEPENMMSVDLDSPIAESLIEADSEQQDEPLIAEGAQFPGSVYFDEGHKPELVDMVKAILAERPCITKRALAFEVAQRHSLRRTSKKQVSHLMALVDSWAGIHQSESHEPVYWLSPDDVVDVLSWRGLSPFGYERDWSEIAFPEALGLAREAIEQQPSDPVDYICNEFKLKRRHTNTLETLQSWVDAAKSQVYEPQLTSHADADITAVSVKDAAAVIRIEATNLGRLSPKSIAALDALERGETNLDQSSINALVHLLAGLPADKKIVNAIKQIDAILNRE
jgi:very-short-patch-repair endonuclease